MTQNEELNKYVYPVPIWDEDYTDDPIETEKGGVNMEISREDFADLLEEGIEAYLRKEEEQPSG